MKNSARIITKSTPNLVIPEETPRKAKLLQTTSPAQLQVYMKPEYVDFTRTLGAKNPQNIRPKRMNI